MRLERDAFFFFILKFLLNCDMIETGTRGEQDVKGRIYYFQKMYSTVLVMLHSAEDAYDVATAAILKLADYCLRGMEWRCRRKCFGWMI